MSIENVVVILIIIGAAGYVVSMIWKQLSAFRAKKRSCGKDCGCDR
jgi:hypothetical protein